MTLYVYIHISCFMSGTAYNDIYPHSMSFDTMNKKQSKEKYFIWSLTNQISNRTTVGKQFQTSLRSICSHAHSKTRNLQPYFRSALKNTQLTQEQYIQYKITGTKSVRIILYICTHLHGKRV